MAEITGSLTAVGVSALLSLDASKNAVAITVTGTWVATWQVEKALSQNPNGGWKPVTGMHTVNRALIYNPAEPNEILRFRTVLFGSGTLAYDLLAVVSSTATALGNLPTSSVGLAAGAFYLNGNVLCVA